MYSGTELKLLLTHGPPTHVFLLILSDWSYSQTCVGVCILWMIDIWTALLIDLLFEGDTAYTIFGIMLQSYSDLTCHVSVRSPCHHILRKGEPSFIHEQHSLKSFKKRIPSTSKYMPWDCGQIFTVGTKVGVKKKGMWNFVRFIVAYQRGVFEKWCLSGGSWNYESIKHHPNGQLLSTFL